MSCRTIVLVFAAALAVSACSAPANSAASGSQEGTVEFAEPRTELSLPVPGSKRANALEAMVKADAFTLYSLQPWTPPHPPTPAPDARSPEYDAYSKAQSAAWERSQREWCSRDA
ncbi:hypothetical protein ACFPN1_09160 [Lysobacter yangpyeongensis]|uniref:Lipoprotein n=1 Tax=Lysobacter yangpyeongensis TaxID=346182 RepID=A0ABW0SN92_9GAMM